MRWVSGAFASDVAGAVDAGGAVVLEAIDTTVGAVAVLGPGSVCLLLAHPPSAAARTTAHATPPMRLAEDAGMAE